MPSTPGQLTLANALVKELQSIDGGSDNGSERLCHGNLASQFK